MRFGLANSRGSIDTFLLAFLPDSHDASTEISIFHKFEPQQYLGQDRHFVFKNKIKKLISNQREKLSHVEEHWHGFKKRFHAERLCSEELVKSKPSVCNWTFVWKSPKSAGQESRKENARKQEKRESERQFWRRWDRAWWRKTVESFWN